MTEINIPTTSPSATLGAFKFDNADLKIFEFLIETYMFFLALSVLCLLYGLKVSLQFSTTVFVICFNLPLAIAIVFFMRQKAHGAPKLLCVRDRWSIIAVITLAVIAGLIAASINRPDIDDSEYLPKAVYFISHPHALLDSNEYYIASSNGTTRSLVFHYYETIQASLASMLDINLLSLYHVAFPALAIGLLIIVNYMVLTIFQPIQWTRVVALFAALMLMLLLGETHRTIGNLFIGRAFHGKFVMLSLGTLAYLYYSIKYFNLRQVHSLIVLATISIASAGMSTTGYIFIPLFAAIIYTAYIFSQNTIRTAAALKLGGTYFLAVVPSVLFAIAYRQTVLHSFGLGSHYNDGFSREFIGQISYLVNSDYPLTPIIFVASTAFVLTKSRDRLFFLLWIGIPVAFLLNPVVSMFVMANLTTENIYWRLFYLLPFPLISLVALMTLLEKFPYPKLLAIVVVSALSYYSIFGPTAVIRDGNATFEPFAFKLPQSLKTQLNQMLAEVPAGTMFAPLDVASNIVILSASYPQFYVREDNLRLALIDVDPELNFDTRRIIAGYLYRQDGSVEAKGKLIALLHSSARPKTFVLYENDPHYPTISQLLIDSGYVEMKSFRGSLRIYSYDA